MLLSQSVTLHWAGARAGRLKGDLARSGLARRCLAVRKSKKQSKEGEFVQRFIMHYLISKVLRYGPCVTKASHSMGLGQSVDTKLSVTAHVVFSCEGCYKNAVDKSVELSCCTASYLW